MASSALLAGALFVPAAARSDVHGGAPGAPTAVHVIDGSATSLTLTWATVGGGPRLAQGFELLKDGATVATTTDNAFSFAGLACGTAYVLGIEAFDAAGRHSARASVTVATRACAGPTRPAPTATPRPPRADERTPQPEANTPAYSSSVPAPPAALEPESDGPLPVPELTSDETSWAGAGAFVWHETDVAPEALGAQLRQNGFSWVAVLIHDGVAVDPIEGDWVRRFQAASQLPTGGWGVLRTQPEREAELADELLKRYSLDFYIANPEAEYKFSGDDGASAERFGRSRRFIDSFRRFQPDMLAAISSYCRADTQDIDWPAWNQAGFAFLPQAYVNDFGGAASPAACAEGATEFFPADEVHPTVGVYTGPQGEPGPERYAALLDEAGTVGFSVYLAETRMHAEQWRTFGDAIVELAIARPGGVERSERTSPDVRRAS